MEESMRRVCVFLLGAALLVLGQPARATVFGNVHGIVHDPQHRPVSGADVQLNSATSDWSQSTRTNADGEFTFPVVPLGDYIVSAKSSGFSQVQQSFTLVGDTSSVLHLQLALASVTQTAVVTASVDEASVESVTPTTLVDRADIAQTPGADLTNSAAMITNFTPGAYLTHDMLHIRGGHQTTWLIDGVPIPNTNIASNVAPQIDPKDVDYVEILRGSYNAGYGDRTYGEFNALPRSGFEGNNDGELMITGGSFYQTNAQLSFASHTQHFAYYASVNGNRSNLGLETPIPQIYHDAANGYGGFTSLIFNMDPSDQLRFDGQLRQDFYQIPYDPDPNDSENQQFDTSGLRDSQRETDSFLIFSWIHTFNPTTVLTVSPFYHYNNSSYNSRPTDTPLATTDHNAENYGGGQAVLGFHLPRNNVQTGIYAWGANSNQFFGLTFNDGSNNPPLSERDDVLGSEEAIYVSDNFSVTSWLNLIGGVRATHFSGGVTENATDPRVGGTLRIPRLNWVFRAFWGKYYQPPPLVTISGPLIQLCGTNDCTFLALPGERDEEHQFGVNIPVRGWSLDIDYFEMRGVNFLDHNNIGESSIFIPVTIAESRIRGTEVTLSSPRMWNRAQAHLAYSNQMAQSQGAFTGGLIVGPPPEPGWGALDHDQRNTLNVGSVVTLPWQALLSANVYYGSGFSNGSPDAQYPGPYLPGHASIDLSLGKQFREKFTFSVTALNVANRHLLIDNSLTFGGFHYNNPREVYAEFRYRFHY
jgi:TonB dependent receptor/Carboxypeptidase regulatory-like domain/TonB-dependent Receptor Plug Domain